MGASFIFLIACSLLNSIQANDDPVVTTAKGTIRGVRSDDGNINMFMGIPYAMVDEANPFGVSTPYSDFDDVFEANDDSSICPQIEEFNLTVVGDLDCLRLNVYTPTYVDSNSRLSVFVWIYGGRFNIGFYGRFLYGPKFLVRHDIIFVTLNYRLGPYGFMCLDIPEIPGNQGLRDQILALRWLKSHISAFGGDPDKITVGGNSAGSMAVNYHLHRDNTGEKLFNQAILQSGTILFLNVPQPPKDVPITLARYFGFETDDIYEAITFLSKLHPHDVILASKSLSVVCEPCVEKVFEGVESYLTNFWVTSNVIPAVKDMPVIIGVNSDESGIMRNKAESRSILSNSLDSLFDTQHEDFRGMSELVKQFYFGDDGLIWDKFVDFTADISIVYPTYRTVYKLLDNNAGNIYFYNFSYIGERNFAQQLKNYHGDGALHADEIGYLFDMEFMPEEPTIEDQLVIDKMTRMWADFVKYGNPTPEISELIDEKWEPLTLDKIYCMDINLNLSLTTSPFAEQVTFWDVFFEKNGHLQRNLNVS